MSVVRALSVVCLLGALLSGCGKYSEPSPRVASPGQPAPAQGQPSPPAPMPGENPPAQAQPTPPSPAPSTNPSGNQ
jgi:hypothetical protein